MARYDNESPLYSKSRICSFRHMMEKNLRLGLENHTGGRKLFQHHIQHHNEYKPESEAYSSDIGMIAFRIFRNQFFHHQKIT